MYGARVARWTLLSSAGGRDLRALEHEHAGRQRVVAEIRKSIARPYRDFITWGSLYEVANEEEEERRREQVSRSLGDLRNRYLPRSCLLYTSPSPRD